MSQPDSNRVASIRAVVEFFLRQRLESKSEGLAADDPQRVKLREQFQYETWLADAARRVRQIQAVTHSLKAIHPDAKGSSYFCSADSLAPLPEVGSHVLGTKFEIDVVGNAAALDVYKLLKLDCQGQSLLSLATGDDPDLHAALSDDPIAARAWMTDFAGLAKARSKLSTHTLAKQIYWLVGSDPHDDSAYHLLAPLYPTSLIHRFYQVLQDDRFGEAAKSARASRNSGEWHERPVREYRDLAIQKLGGTNPQNISQLNRERRGDNCLLASVPPVWRTSPVNPLFGVNSLFTVFGWRQSVRSLVQDLRRFLESDPVRNKETRERRDALTEVLLDELMQFTAGIRTLDPGWTSDPKCTLPPIHCGWLDPEGTGAPAVHVSDHVAGDFANWLNGHLRNRLPVGDAEYLNWRRQAHELFKHYEGEGAYEQ